MAMRFSVFFMLLLLSCSSVFSQHSVARDWNEEMLHAIRNDFARPTVHARNLFHGAIAMYDAWAIFNDTATPVLLGNTFQGFSVAYDPLPMPSNPDEATHEVMSYALYRLMQHRFKDSPGADEIFVDINQRMASYGYNLFVTSTDYSDGSYAKLGNYLASQIIAFGLQDGSNEENDYASIFYAPVNPPLILEVYDEIDHINPDRWQPLAFASFIDQSGNIIPGGIPNFLSPEWGQVAPFALDPDDLEILNNGFNSYVYNDPGAPPTIQDSPANGLTDAYKWHFALVSAWSSHLDPSDPLRIDISPANLGNLDPADWPETFSEYQDFYDFTEGGALSQGHDVNPVTGLPYAPQMVKRSDYARVLAEFWADGPDSETPPGHWFVIANYVSDDPLLEKRFGGEGPILSDLEWDVKMYLTLGGAMHDSAVTTWGIKGYYDYVRPISALRYMAAKGQSTDPSLPGFDPHGLPLVPGLIELIEAGDPLAADGNIGEVKVRAWKGPDYIEDPTTDIAGVDWILATRWWPYQRGTFVTPPFAGYVSGHSTFSRAAAEVLTFVTGDPFFPGGMGSFEVEQDTFLFFEKGPSEPFTLQWATYRDASDQTSLSRIWGGIHPPIDDIPGRRLGADIGVQAFNLAADYFNGDVLGVEENELISQIKLYPNPVQNILQIAHPNTFTIQKIEVFDMASRKVISEENKKLQPAISVGDLTDGVYLATLYTDFGTVVKRFIVNK
ncbi:MAG TPA: T9SS type A sorting domain-containing protein [Flavobacteriaceae bacterium]|nr:T9SS type A sorting domain-containing protein [Flavobacteriaceae bacterium]HIN98190.1 T9SS type A sorting domain-containing protein [Flavobacteriaceae bacterium]